MAAEPAEAHLIVIVGETASGKSRLALELAQEFNGEIICGDSRTIYRGMDIGTAKPAGVDRQKIPHHLLDIVDPDERYTAAQFQQLAKEVIMEIWRRGKIPIMVGGSGLYVDSVIFDYDFRPKSTNGDELEHMTLDELVAIAKQRHLNAVDTKNRRYLIRLLGSGQEAPENRGTIRPNTLIIGIKTERSELRKGITNRVEAMFKMGLRKEVDSLLQKYNWDDPGMSGIGYREFRDYYSNDISMSQVKQRIIRNTLQFAKRQRTWFKRNSNIIWLDNISDTQQIVKEFIADINYN